MQKSRLKCQLKAIRVLMICIFSFLFIFSGYKIISLLSEYKETEKEYEGIVNEAVTVIVSESHTQSSDQLGQNENKKEETKLISETPPISVDFTKLKAINKNCVAWIYAEGTPINYPIVKTEGYEEYDHYLTHTFTGIENKAGTIFTDYRNAKEQRYFNLITYGHSMKNGSMYAYLLRYKNQSFYDEHPFMWLYTDDGGIYKIELISGREVHENSEDYIMYSDKEKFDAYLKNSVDSSHFKTKFDVSAVEQIITLSTCSYGGDNMRYVVLGNIKKYN